MRVGVHINRFDHPAGGPALGAELAAARCRGGGGRVSWLSVMDHYFQMEFNGGAEDPMLEAYTTLGFLAAHTYTVRLGALVTGVTYRHPGLLAKIAHHARRALRRPGHPRHRRRLVRPEHEGLGVPFPPLAERFERLEETLQICLQMWDPAANGPFEGTHYRLAETLCVAGAGQQPAPRDHDRRRRREEDPAPGRPLRRRLQPLRHLAAGGRAQARRAARPLRRPRAATTTRSAGP